MIPALVTPMEHRCVAIRSSALLLFTNLTAKNTKKMQRKEHKVFAFFALNFATFAVKLK